MHRPSFRNNSVLNVNPSNTAASWTSRSSECRRSAGRGSLEGDESFGTESLRFCADFIFLSKVGWQGAS